MMHNNPYHIVLLFYNTINLHSLIPLSRCAVKINPTHSHTLSEHCQHWFPSHIWCCTSHRYRQAGPPDHRM